MSKEKKIHKTNAIRMIEQKKIRYKDYSFQWSEDHRHDERLADDLTEDHLKLFKTIVTIGNKTGVIVAVIPSDQEVDLKKLAQVSGNKKMELLPVKLLEETTGYIRGGCSPIGMKKIFPTYLAKEAELLDHIIVSAGQRGHQIGLSLKDILALTNGKIVAITQKS